MHQKIDEQIEVEVMFFKNRVKPVSFSLSGRVYDITTISLVHYVRQGQEKIYYFSVSDGTNFFRLRFSTDSLKWYLEEIYNEG